MARLILIPLSGSDLIEDVLPYIERVAQPGMKAVFLVHVGLSRFEEITEQLLATQGGWEPASLSRRNDDEDLVKQRIRSAEEKIFAACAALRETGMEIAVSVFSGSLRKIVRDYALTEDVHLVMMRGEVGNWLTRALRHTASHLHKFRAETLPPVLLFHPSSIAGRLDERR